MSYYTRISNIKNSIYLYIKNKLENLGYIFDDTHWKFLDEYPYAVEISVPTMAISFLDRSEMSQWDLGNQGLFGYDFILDAFCRDNLQRENWIEDCSRSLEKGRASYFDYDQDATPILGYLSLSNIRGETITVIEPTNIERYRAAVRLRVETLGSY